MPQQPGPDFLCIGMQKAGTGWLFDQLQFHPDFWITPVKELHYLDRALTKTGNVERFLEITEKPKRMANMLKERRPWDERDIEFLKLFASYRRTRRDLDKYAALFQFKRDRISGDITPGYSGLSSELVAEIGERFPHLRVIIIIRDPVARVWSQISMSYRNDKFDKTLLERPDEFRDFLKHAEAISNIAYPSRIAERWFQNAPRIPFQHYFFDDVVGQPAKVRREILQFLGGDPDKPSGDLPPDHNRKSKDEKLAQPDNIKAVIVEQFRDELRACAKMFGGPAEVWAARYGA